MTPRAGSSRGRGGELGEDVQGALVADRVDRVEAQAVDAHLADPEARDWIAHSRTGSAVLVVEVDRLAPERLVLVGEVGPKASIALTPEAPRWL
jgi:hypothetical protein